MATMIAKLARRWALAAAAVAVVVLITACDDTAKKDDASGGSASTGDATTGPDGTEDTDENGDSGDGAVNEQSSKDVLTGAECLPGNWYLDNEEFGVLMSSATGTVDDVAGTVMLTLTGDGKTKTHYDKWSHTITTGSATVTIVKHGVDNGTYSVTADGTMSIVEATIMSETTSKMDIAGTKVTRASTPEPSVFSQSTFTCEGDDLTVTSGDRTAVMHREH